jgi:hypothetical protein
MNKAEFKQAFAVAKSDVNLSEVDNTLLYGCGLPGFEPVYCTTRQVAKLLRWQAQNLNGSWDMGEVNNIAKIAQRKFLIIE